MRALSFILILVAVSLADAATLTPLGDASSNKVPYVGATQNIDAGAFNFSASWFNGAFNWTESSVYLSFDGSNLDFNDTLLNETIDAKLASTTYFPTEYFTLYGTESGGNNIGNLSLYDNEFFNITEDGGGDALEFYVNFTGVTDFNNLLMRERYLGGNGHQVVVELYDFILTDWEGYLSITDQAVQVVSNTPVTDPTDHISGGVVQLRFRHIQNGIASHKLIIDYIQLINGSSTITNIDHDGLSGRDNIENHPWALPTDGSRALTANWAAGAFNITGLEGVESDGFCNSSDCYSVTELLAGADTWWGLNELYVYNNSDSLDFNETLLNATIEALSDVDTDTNCTVNTSCSTILYADGSVPLADNWAAGAFNITGLDGVEPNKITVSAATADLIMAEYTGASGAAVVQVMKLQYDQSDTAQDDDGLRVLFQMDDDGGTASSVAAVDGIWSDASDGAEKGDLVFYTRNAGAFDESMRIVGGGDTIINPLTNLYIGASLSAPTSKDLRAKTLYSDTGGVTAWDVENDTLFDIKKLKEIKAITVNGKGVWDLSGIVKLDSKGKVTQSVLNTVEVEKTELKTVTKDGLTREEYVGTGIMVNSTWVDTGELSGFLIGVLKAQQKQIDFLTSQLELLTMQTTSSTTSSTTTTLEVIL